jgi:hypothetical protein
VQLTSEGEVGVSQFGYGAGAGVYLASTGQEPFGPLADVFTRSVQTLSPVAFADDYATTATVDLVPGLVYFGNLAVGCNQFSSAAGSWTCGAQASARFAIDQAAFDSSQGEQTFDLSQYFELARSPNLVPEASSTSLATGAFGALALMRLRKRTRHVGRPASRRA